MAKNAFQKKKRIAHFQNVFDNFTEGKNENALSGCLDYVSSIIQNMDSSFISMHSNCSKTNARTQLTNNDGQKDISSVKSSSISSASLSQNPKNFKRKFSLSRKFPLMEKSQKILRQIKHNRNISKPRAHLAAFPESPIKADAIKMPNMKKKYQNLKDISKLKNNSNSNDSIMSDIFADKLHDVNNKDLKINNCKISKKSVKVSCKKGENTKSMNLSGTMTEDLYNASSRLNMNTNIEKNCLSDTKDGENETTDSEYERFVKKSKKGLQKKVIKRRKQSTAKSRAIIKESKSRVLNKNILKQCDSFQSDSDDDEIPLPRNSRKVSPFKKQKVAHHVLTGADNENLNEESEPDMIDDHFAQGSSSESDGINNKASDKVLPVNANRSCSPLQKVGFVCDSDSGSDATLPDLSVSHNKTASESYKIADNVVPNSYTPGVFLSDISGSVDTDKTKLNNCTSNLVIDLCDSDDDSKEAEFNEHPTISVPVEGKDVETHNSISLCKSNDDCNNTVSKELTLDEPKEEKTSLIVAPQNVISLDSEESDLEIIEVLPSCLKSGEYVTNVVANMPNHLNSEAKSPAVENDILGNFNNRNTQQVIKTEKLSVIADTINRNIRTEDSKYEAVYMTNICNDVNQDKLARPAQRTLINSDCKELLGTSSCSVLDNTVLKKVVKTENYSDDDVVILDSDQTSPETLPGIVSNISSYNKIQTETADIVESLKHVKYSAQNILKIENNSQPQNYSGTSVAIDKGHINMKSEQANESLSSLDNRCLKEYVNSKIKNTSFIKQDLKLSEDMCLSSKILPLNLSGVTYEGNQEYKNSEQMNEFHLIELYKKEFQTYQEIVQAEASVGARLKLLEIHQAEKVKHIQSLVKKYVGRDQVSRETFNSSVNKEKYRDVTLSERKGLNTFNGRPSTFSHIDITRETQNSVSEISKVKPVFLREFSNDLPSSLPTAILTSPKIDNDIKPNISLSDGLQNVQLLQQSTVIPKQEPGSSQGYLNSSSEKKVLKLLNEKCNVCGKGAVAACQSCAKVFFCSHECGRKFWNDGHVNECGK